MRICQKAARRRRQRLCFTAQAFVRDVLGVRLRERDGVGACGGVICCVCLSLFNCVRTSARAGVAVLGLVGGL